MAQMRQTMADAQRRRQQTRIDTVLWSSISTDSFRRKILVFLPIESSWLAAPANKSWLLCVWFGFFFILVSVHGSPARRSKGMFFVFSVFFLVFARTAFTSVVIASHFHRSRYFVIFLFCPLMTGDTQSYIHMHQITQLYLLYTIGHIAISRNCNNMISILLLLFFFLVCAHARYGCSPPTHHRTMDVYRNLRACAHWLV